MSLPITIRYFAQLNLSYREKIIACHVQHLMGNRMPLSQQTIDLKELERIVYREATSAGLEQYINLPLATREDVVSLAAIRMLLKTQDWNTDAAPDSNMTNVIPLTPVREQVPVHATIHASSERPGPQPGNVDEASNHTAQIIEFPGPQKEGPREVDTGEKRISDQGIVFQLSQEAIDNPRDKQAPAALMELYSQGVIEALLDLARIAPSNTEAYKLLMERIKRSEHGEQTVQDLETHAENDPRAITGLRMTAGFVEDITTLRLPNVKPSSMAQRARDILKTVNIKTLADIASAGDTEAADALYYAHRAENPDAYDALVDIAYVNGRGVDHMITLGYRGNDRIWDELVPIAGDNHYVVDRLVEYVADGQAEYPLITLCAMTEVSIYAIHMCCDFIEKKRRLTEKSHIGRIIEMLKQLHYITIGELAHSDNGAAEALYRLYLATESQDALRNLRSAAAVNPHAERLVTAIKT